MLTPEHREFLSSQAVDVELAEALGVTSILRREDAEALGEEFPWTNYNRWPYLAFPWTAPDGRTEWQVRPDDPAPDPSRPGKLKKYTTRSRKSGFQPVLWAVAPIIDSTSRIMIPEGTKQTLAAASNCPDGVAVYGIAGCRMWQQDGEPIPDLKVVDGYPVTVVFDADAGTNPEVYRAGEAFKAALLEAGATDVTFGALEAPEDDAKAGLDDVLGGIPQDGRQGFLESLIVDALPLPSAHCPKDAGDELEALLADAEQAEDESPWLDLGPYLNGDYEPPQPAVGARRSDGRALLYEGKCHFLVGETGIGKSWFGCHHAAAELMAGATVVYAHFEEPNPAATVARLGRLGVPAEVIAAGLRWLDVDKASKYRKGLKALDQAPRLVILDGVVAACGGKSINDDDTVNWFREKYVNPATRMGAAVLALHHPVKDPTRRGERGGRGSGSWINLVDGVHFQAEPGKTWIGRGRKGWIDLYADKDREGAVMDGATEHPRNAGWRLLGRLEVQDVDGKVRASITAPVAAEPDQGAGQTNEVRELAEHIVLVLQLHGGSYPTQGELSNWLRAQNVKVRNGDLGPALQWLEDRGRLSRPPYEDRKARPGQLIPGELGSGS